MPVKLEFTADDAKALAALQRLSLKQDETINKLKGGMRSLKAETKTLGDQSDTSFGSMYNGAKKVLGVLGIGMGIHQGISKAIELTESWSEHLRAVGDRAAKAAGAMFNLAMLQQPNEMKGRIKEAAMLGAQYGVPRTAALDVVQAMQSMPGISWKEALAISEQVFLGTKAGLNAEETKDFVASMQNRGEPAWMGAYLPYATGKASPKYAGFMTKAASAMPFWQNPKLAMAASVPIIPNMLEEYPTYLRRAGAGLTGINKDTDALWKRLGVTGGTQEEKLSAMYGAGMTTQESMARAGFGNVREQVGLSLITQKWPEVMALKAKLEREASPDFVRQEIERVAGNVPAVRLAHEQDRQNALRIAGLTGSPTETRGMITDLADQVASKRMADIEATFPKADEETGKFSWFQRNISLPILHPRVARQRDIQEKTELYEQGLLTPVQQAQLREGLSEEIGRGVSFETRTLDELLRVMRQIESNTSPTKKSGPISPGATE
jgi:hypothetical protein